MRIFAGLTCVQTHDIALTVVINLLDFQWRGIFFRNSLRVYLGIAARSRQHIDVDVFDSTKEK